MLVREASRDEWTNPVGCNLRYFQAFNATVRKRERLNESWRTTPQRS